MHPCIVIRHAAAADPPASGQDADRPLSDKGWQAMTDAARGLAAAAARPEVILSSPFLRAHQTAEIVAEAFGGVPFETLDILAAGASASDIIAALAERCHRPSGGLAVVGHEPDLGRFVSYALAASARSFHTPRKGSACMLEFPAMPRAGNATLEWIMEPQHLRAVGLAAQAARESSR